MIISLSRQLCFLKLLFFNTKMLAELLVSGKECFFKIKIIQTFFQQSPSRMYYLIVTVHQEHRKCFFFFNLTIQISLNEIDFGF